MQFKDVLVDNSLKIKLLELAKSGRMAHAQFFLAQPGSHSLALAVALGQYLCCENPSDDDSCGECPSCRQFAKLSHPDLHIYFPNCTTESVKKDPESSKLMLEFRDFVLAKDFHIDINSWLNLLRGENKQPSINIRDCSDILHHNSTRSHQNGYKVYILWCADKLYRDAAPKLLKTLEEPEENSLFILISEEPDKILNTILSRTQLIKIPRLSDSDVAANLKLKFPDMTDEEVSDTAIIADGNFIKAMQIASDKEDENGFIEHFSTLFGSSYAFSHTRNPSEINFPNVLKMFESISGNGREYQKQFLSFSLKMLRNILMMNNGNQDILKATGKEKTALDGFRGRLNLKQISLMYDLCNKAHYSITRNGNPNIIFTDLYFKLAQASV